MKKVTLLAAALAALSLLAGCGSSSAPAAATQATLPAVTEAAETTQVEETQAPEIAKVLPDGVYTVDFVTDSSMFRANEACNGKGTLTVSDGVQTLHVSLRSTNIVNLFVGTAEDAQKPGAVLLDHTVDTVTYSDEIGRAHV